ncbi:MAG: enoyl-CoA hydratase-related protein [Candidatus Binatia bacterium]|nr:enoyl-CoA hydratase-related protein [Candidatus Binatia bacterium]
MTQRRSASSGVRLQRRGAVAVLSFLAPSSDGWLDATTDSQLSLAIEEVSFDDAVRVLLLRSQAREFCLGLTETTEPRRLCAITALASVSCPVIAVIQGGAVAEGCELALACDLRFASARAYFALPQLRDGRFPCNGATQRLPRLIGRMRALELLWTGRRLSARQALQWGLVNAVHPDARLFAAAEDFARELAERAPLGLRYIKEAVGQGLDGTLEQGLRLEEDLYVLLQTTEDWRAGIEAFRLKKRPRFRGR